MRRAHRSSQLLLMQTCAGYRHFLTRTDIQVPLQNIDAAQAIDATEEGRRNADRSTHTHVLCIAYRSCFTALK